MLLFHYLSGPYDTNARMLLSHAYTAFQDCVYWHNYAGVLTGCWTSTLICLLQAVHDWIFVIHWFQSNKQGHRHADACRSVILYKDKLFVQLGSWSVKNCVHGLTCPCHSSIQFDHYLKVHCNTLSAAGNTCFVNVALQCLRYTPQLATAIIPDLMTLSPLPEDGPFPNSSLALPRISLQQSPVKHSSHEDPHDLPQSSSPQQLQLTAQTLDSHAAPPEQQASLLPEEGNQHQHVGHEQTQAQQAATHGAQQQSVASTAAQLPEVSSVVAPSQQYDEGKQHQSNALQPSPQALHSAGDGGQSAQQGDSSQLQSVAPQQQPADVPAVGDDSAAAPPNESTTEKQPPPVAPVRIPLKKGEIADAFRALVREVCKHLRQPCPVTFLHLLYLLNTCFTFSTAALPVLPEQNFLYLLYSKC